MTIKSAVLAFGLALSVTPSLAEEQASSPISHEYLVKVWGETYLGHLNKKFKEMCSNLPALYGGEPVPDHVEIKECTNTAAFSEIAVRSFVQGNEAEYAHYGTQLIRHSNTGIDLSYLQQSVYFKGLEMAFDLKAKSPERAREVMLDRLSEPLEYAGLGPILPKVLDYMEEADFLANRQVRALQSMDFGTPVASEMNPAKERVSTRGSSQHPG